MLYKPDSRRAARVYKSTKVKHWWPDQEQGFSGGFYAAEVVNVPQAPVKGDEEGIYLTLQCLPLPDTSLCTALLLRL